MSDDLVKQFIAELQDLVQCRCHEAFKGRGLHDPDCHCDTAEAVKVVADRIEELEAKLAKAAKALRWYRRQMCEGFCNDLPSDGVCTTEMENECCGCKARATLAELKGGKDE